MAPPSVQPLELYNPALSFSRFMTGENFFQRLLPSLITLGFVIGAIVFVFILITGAIQWMNSGGDKMANEEARKKITNAVIGLVVLFSVFAIINLVEIFFGVDITVFDLENISLL